MRCGPLSSVKLSIKIVFSGNDAINLLDHYISYIHVTKLHIKGQYQYDYVVCPHYEKKA